MTKEDIISLINIKDYNNILEGILETKDFSEDVKNLLLSMLYKIENSYDDYEKVKVDVQTKKQYIKEILNTINSCNKINLAKQNTKEFEELQKENKNYKIDKEKKEIIVYQNEQMMLEALQEVLVDQMVTDEEKGLYEKIFKDVLINGYVSNNVEVIRDFNGWSWDSNTRDIKDINYNLIYQNILLLFGYEFIDCVINNCKDEEIAMPNNEILRSKYSQIASFEEDRKKYYIQEMQEILKEDAGEELAKEFIEKLKKMLLVFVSNRDERQRKQILLQKKENEEELEKMKNFKNFLEEITKRKKELASKIKKIDNVVNNTKTLKLEYEKVNKKLPNKEKIFSASQFANKLIYERKEYMKEINTINAIMDPKEFVKQKEEKEKTKEYLDEWTDEKTIIQEDKFIIDFQIIFLKCMEKLIQKEDNKKEISNYIYRLRYYEYIPYNNTNIGKIKEIQKEIKKVENLLISKSCDKKILTRVSEQVNTNVEILKNIFTSKIINLDNMIIIFKFDKETLVIEIYDGNIIENVIEKKIKEKTELSVRLKKKIKIFN